MPVMPPPITVLTDFGESLEARLKTALSLYLNKPLVPSNLRAIQDEADRIAKVALEEFKIQTPDFMEHPVFITLNRTTQSVSLAFHPLVRALMTEALY